MSLHQPSNRAVASRIKGQTAITKTLQLLIVRAHRYANHRATTDAQRAWAAGVIAAVQAALDVPTTGERNYPRTPVHKSNRMLKMFDVHHAVNAESVIK